MHNAILPFERKNKIVNDVANATKSYLVDLSNIPLVNKENYAKNELGYKGDRTIWKVDGIGEHPGDIGMRNIADQILLTIRAAFSK